jgi:outer membrane murein-binding lipoprotein Lpp
VEGKPAWSRLTLPLPQVVRVVSRALLTCLFCAAFTSIFPAQQDDPSEIFLKAYLSAQQAEKLEHENRFKNALAKFRFAGSLIEELRRAHPEWQPAIVEYRGRKIGDGILRIQEHISRQNDLHATASPLPDIVPSLPEGEAWSEPGPEVVAPQVTGTISQRSSDATIEDATRNLRGKVDQLQKALEQSRSELETARKDKEAVNARLQETSFSLTDAQKEIDTRKESERQVREQLVEISQGNGATEQLRAQIADLKKQVAVAQGASAAAEKQRDEANAKLADVNRQIAAVEQQRDAALVPIAENSDFTLIPAGTRNMRSADDDSTGPGELGGATQEVTQIQQQLAESQRQNQYLIARIGELWVQLDEAGAQLQRVKQTGKNSEELDQLIRENEVLRNIVVRERQEEVRRAEAKKRMLAELDGLKVKSDTLNREIELLVQPVPELSSEEVSVLEKPVVSTSDENRGVVTAHFIFAKKSPEDSAEPEATVNGSSRSKGEAREDLQSVAHAATGNLNSTSARQKATSETLDQGSE